MFHQGRQRLPSLIGIVEVFAQEAVDGFGSISDTLLFCGGVGYVPPLFAHYFCDGGSLGSFLLACAICFSRAMPER